MLLTCVLLCALGAGDAPAPATAKTAEPQLHPLQVRMVERVNVERRRRGMRALVIDRRLMRSASRHTRWMARSQNLQHTSEGVAENIAMGQQDSAQAVESWMDSPGHRANILGSYSKVGAAAYQAADGTVYWCLQLL